MTKSAIARIGAYLPLTRFERSAGAAALRWAGLGGPKDGRRAVAGWDEDALTLAVEAARVAVGERAPADLVFASTSAPFIERSHATLVGDALNLSPATTTMDVAGTRRCAIGALLRALRDPGADSLIAAGERRETSAGSAHQLAWGDGGAAVRVAADGPVRLLDAASLSHDLVDIYASRAHPTPYQAEERFVREATVNRVLAPTVRAACAQAGIEPSAIALAAVHEPVGGSYRALASKLGISAPNMAEELAVAAGDLGAAHALFALALALDRAAPGDIVLLASFGSGCDALLFEVDGSTPGAASAEAALRQGLACDDYVRFLSLTGSLALDWGARAELDQKVPASVLARHGREMMGFVGGRDTSGNVQFPKSPMPASPGADGPETLEDVRFADEPARVVSFTADRLNFTPDPPFHFGLAQFDNGARALMEFTDTVAGGLPVGDPLRMRFRIKALDRKRGFRTYFWKAAPRERPTLEN